MTKLKGDVVTNLQYAEGSPEYLAALQESQKTGNCIFCGNAFRNNPERPILFRSEGWFVRERDPIPSPDDEGGYPDRYFLIVRDEHDCEFYINDGPGIFLILSWLVVNAGLTGYGLCIRMGDPVRSGRTIVHPHAHVVQVRQKSDPNDPAKVVNIPWRFPVG